MMKRKPAMVVVVLAMTFMTGCSTWRPATAGLGTVIAEQRPSSVRLTLTDGTVALLSSPLILNDSIVSGGIAGPRVAVTEVEGLEVKRLSVGRTIGLIAVAAVAAVAWTAFATGSSSGGEDGSDPLPKGLAPNILSGLGWLVGLIP